MKAGKVEKKEQTIAQTNKQKPNTNKSNQEGKSECNQKKQTRARTNKINDRKKKVAGKQIKYCDIYRALWGDRGEVERRSPKPWCFFQAQAGAGPFQTVAVLLTPLSLRSSVTVIPWALITWPQTAGRSPRIALTNKINTQIHNTQNTDYYFIDQWMPSG